MIIQADQSIAEILLTDRIERTADGLDKSGWLLAFRSLTVGTFQGTQAVVTVIAGEDAVSAPDDARHEIAIAVGIGHALAVDDRLRRCRKHGPYVVQHFFHAGYLVQGNGCAVSTLDAADALALLIVATEAFGQNLRGNQHSADFQDGWYFTSFHSFVKYFSREVTKKQRNGLTL